MPDLPSEISSDLDVDLGFTTESLYKTSADINGSTLRSWISNKPNLTEINIVDEGGRNYRRFFKYVC